jgi:hypothetical protein
MPSVFQHAPWVGSQYPQGGIFGKRVLVVGDLRDQWPADFADRASATRLTIEQQLARHRPQAFWSGLAYALLGHALSGDRKQAFFDSLAVYDFVQDGAAPVRAATGDVDRDNRAAFLAAVASLDPALVLVLGYRLWNRLPAGREPGATIPGAPYEQTRVYGGDPKRRATAFCLRRPSTAGYGPVWHQFVRRALEIA